VAHAALFLAAVVLHVDAAIDDANEDGALSPSH
jgi:hypothetical protein